MTPHVPFRRLVWVLSLGFAAVLLISTLTVVLPELQDAEPAPERETAGRAPATAPAEAASR